MMQQALPAASRPDQPQRIAGSRPPERHPVRRRLGVQGNPRGGIGRPLRPHPQACPRFARPSVGNLLQIVITPPLGVQRMMFSSLLLPEPRPLVEAVSGAHRR